MVGPNITRGLVGNNSRQHLAAPAAISMVIPLEASSSTTSGKRVRKNNSFVDPCAIAPLKKRRIQVSHFISALAKAMIDHSCLYNTIHSCCNHYAFLFTIGRSSFARWSRQGFTEEREKQSGRWEVSYKEEAKSARNSGRVRRLLGSKWESRRANQTTEGRETNAGGHSQRTQVCPANICMSWAREKQLLNLGHECFQIHFIPSHVVQEQVFSTMSLSCLYLLILLHYLTWIDSLYCN